MIGRRPILIPASVLLVTVLLTSCDNARVYEENREFTDRSWKVTEEPRFEFSIADTSASYQLHCDVRNSLEYPYARIFVMAHLYDSAQKEIGSKLLNYDLFDQKTGRPLGTSGLGDLYDHRFPMWSNHKFARSGRYSVKLDQFMRTDTLQGLVAIGLRVEKSEQSN